MYPASPSDEIILLQQIAGGNEASFAQLFYAYHQELGAFIFHLTKSMTLSEEVVQEVFIKVWAQRAQLAQVQHFRAYLWVMARNHAYNVLRQQAQEAVRQQQFALHHTAESEEVPAEDFEKYYTLVEEAVQQLPPQQQKIWLLSRKDGLKHEEIASRLLLSRETVKRHISLAVHGITRYVKQHAGEALPMVMLLIRYWKA